MALPILYYLVPNYLTTDPNDQYARVSPRGIYQLDDIIKNCLKRGTTINEADLRGATDLVFNEIIDSVSQGFNVNTKLANFTATINGSFTSKTDSFDPARHSKRVSASMGIDLWKAIQNASVEKIASPEPAPIVIEFSDVNSGTINSTLTSGGLAEITGVDLKYNKANANEGIFFVPVGGGAAVKVTVVAIQTEGKLNFLVPAGLAAGNYQLEVAKGYTAANNIRKGVLYLPLTVL